MSLALHTVCARVHCPGERTAAMQFIALFYALVPDNTETAKTFLLNAKMRPRKSCSFSLALLAEKISLKLGCLLAVKIDPDYILIKLRTYVYYVASLAIFIAFQGLIKVK